MREVQFLCPTCDTDLRLLETTTATVCPACQTRLDVPALLAYLRGLEAFDEGQETMLRSGPLQRRKLSSADERAAMKLFREAYTSLQLAFEGDLVDDQRQLGIEMMASMAQEFERRSMVSAYEGQYWRGVMAELTSQNEYALLAEKLRSASATSINALLRWRWRSRQTRLLAELKDLERKLARLEEQIEFVDLPRARNRKWRP
jgi:hypothetical protein